MPITPEQAEKMSDGEMAQIMELEHEIDRKILEAYRIQGGPYIREYGISVNIPPGVGARAVSKVEELYARAGWKIKSHSDQRDGEWFSLKPLR